MYLDVANFLELATYTATLVTILPANGRLDGTNQWAAGVIALLLAFVVMLVQLQL